MMALGGLRVTPEATVWSMISTILPDTADGYDP